MIKNPKQIYEDLAEHFLDCVYGHECKVTRLEWITEVSKQLGYVFKATEIRKKLVELYEEGDVYDEVKHSFITTIANNRRASHVQYHANA
jgi:hypothetical protein